MDETIKLLQNACNDHERYIIVSNLTSNELKLKYLFFVKSESYRALIIVNINDDIAKVQFLKTLKEEYNCYIIIKSLKSESLKIKYLNTIKNEDYKIEIIKNLNNDEYKESIIDSFKSPYYHAVIIASLKSDELKKKYFPSLNKKELLIVVSSLNDDESKMEYLKLFNDDEGKEKIIRSLKSENLKFNYLNYLSDEAKIRVIAEFKDYSKMNEALNNVSDYIVKVSIVDYLTDDSKINLISQNIGKFRIDLIASLKSENLKLIFLNEIDNSIDRLTILMSMSDEIKEKYINSFNSYEEKIALIYSINDINKRNFYRNLYERNLTFDLKLDEKLQFGLEIEIEGVNSKNIKNWKFGNTSFRSEHDGTLIKGIEIKTPKMSNNSYTINELYNICNMINYGGFTCSSRTGGHIHYDSSYFDKKEDYYGLLEIWSNAEEIFYLISNDIFDFPRKDVHIFATTFFTGIEDQLENNVINSFNLDSEEFIENIKTWQTNKYTNLNLIHVKNDLNTIEFRIANGTISFPIWIQNIKLFGRLMMVSKRISQVYQGNFNDKFANQLWQLKEDLKTQSNKETKLEIILMMLFDESEKEIYRKRYYANKEGVNNLAQMEFKALTLKKGKDNCWHL